MSEANDNHDETTQEGNGESSQGGGSNNTLMLVLAYLWLLCLIPLLVEKDDEEVQWHAKNGLALFLVEVAIGIFFSIVAMVPFLGLISLVGCVLYPAFLVIHIVAIVKATKGERWRLPLVTDIGEKF